MRTVLKRVFFFVLAFGIITQIIPRSKPLETEIVSSENPVISEAVENIRFYSFYNYQTLTQAKLNRITDDFYLPLNYNDVLITYRIESEYLELADVSETISLQTGDVEVIRVSLRNTPSILKGEQSFTIIATFHYQDASFEQTYTGRVIPVIPSDFFGGSLYTIVTYGKMFFEGALLTLGISLVGTIAGFILALFLATSRLVKITIQDNNLTKFFKGLINKFSALYITVFRGTPMIVQASFFWYGFGLFGDPLLCGLFVVSLNTAAYIAEIIRGGIQAIDKGQTEAALSVGLNYSQTMLFVIFPQAIKNSMPAIGNEFVINIKDTAVLSVIGIFELFNQARKVTGMHYRQLEAYAIVALIYLFLTYSISSILKYIEKKMDMQPVDLVSSN
ncbi:MAG: amino acid ABC transporter permease [Bacillota bacterium]